MRVKKFAAALAIISLLPSYILAAVPVYNDVDITHYAYSSIVKMAEKGVLVGDTSGNYRPDAFLDKFETSKILASLAGYKQIDYSETEKSFYDRAYEKNKSLISQYGKTYTKWNVTADKEIAYLIEKEIMTPEDLNQFVVVRSGAEAVRALSREEAAVFMVKLMGRKTEALSAVNLLKYNDDLKISAAAKPYVYYMKNTGLMKGDEQSNFNPNLAVSRADMAVLLDNVLAAMDSLDPDTRTAQAEEAGAVTAPETGRAARIESVSGSFDRLFEYGTTTAVQIAAEDGSRKIYKAAAGIIVYIDGFLKTPSDLKQGMALTMSLNNLEVTEIKAQTHTQAIGAAGTNGSVAVTAQDLAGSVMLNAVEGVVASLSADSVTKTIGIELRVPGANGQIITETKTYAAAEGLTVTRGGRPLDFVDIRLGDICTAHVSGAKVYALALTGKDREITGLLRDKKPYETGVVLVIEDTGGITYELKCTVATEVTREGFGRVSPEKLRIGDSLTVNAEYDMLLKVKAEGSRAFVSGTVEEIHITGQGAYILLKEGSKVNKYTLVMETVDLKQISIGASVKLMLDSDEVESVIIVSDEYGKTHVSGVITAKRSSSVVIETTGGTREIGCNSGTYILNALTGAQMTVNELGAGMKVFAFLIGSTASSIVVIIEASAQ